MISYNLYNWSFLLIVMEVATTFVASFFSLFLWKRTRRAAEIFLVMTSLATFAKAMYRVFLVFGFFDVGMASLKGFPLPLFILHLLPYLFLICSILFFIKEK